MENYKQLCINLVNDLNNDTPKDVFKRYFDYPERKDFINLVCANLNVLCIQDKADDVMHYVHDLLYSIITNPEGIALDIKTEKEALLDLFKVNQLNYRTTSVEYVDGKLRYCTNQNIKDFIGGNKFYIDRLNTLDIPIQIASSFAKSNTDDSVKALFADKIKVLKRLTKLFSDDVDETCAFIDINRKQSRIKVSQESNNGILNVTVN